LDRHSLEPKEPALIGTGLCRLLDTGLREDLLS
jgi:hypothetical protein